MSLTIEEGIRLLQTSGAKITSQRIAIMQALEGRTDHPSAEQIYSELKPLYPKLSIATIYSTAQLLAQASLMRTLSIDDKKVYFDSATEPHGHFMCRSCRKIVDVPVDIESIYHFAPSGDIANVDYTEVFHYGTCTDCAEKKKQ